MRTQKIAIAVGNISLLKNMQSIFRIVNSGHVVNAESQLPKRRKLDTTVAANTAANVHAIFLKRGINQHHEKCKRSATSKCWNLFGRIEF
jgi:hypothetical protein